jgi:hypothetical protein
MPTAIDNKFSKRARIRLVNRGMTVTQLALDLKRPRQTVSAVINGSRRFPILRSLIAKHLRLSHP